MRFLNWLMRRQDIRKFKYCLTKVKTKARIKGKTIEVRPENVDDFCKVTTAAGLTDSETQRIIKYLRTYPGEYVRFEH